MLLLTPLLALLVTTTPEVPRQAPLLKAEASEFEKWRTPASDTLAVRLSLGEEAAYAEVFRALEGTNAARAREAIAALTSIDRLEGWRQLRRRCARWEQSLDRKNVLPQERGCGFPVTLAALESVARRLASPPEAIVMELARRGEPDEVQDLYVLVWFTRPLWEKLIPLVAEARPEAVENLGLRAFIARVDSDVATNKPQEYQKEAKKLSAYKEAKDRKALLAFARSPEPMYLLRLLAAYHLAELGDGSALDLFEDPSYLAPGDGSLVRSSLEELLSKTQGPLRERIQVLLRPYSEARHPAEGAKLNAKERSK